MDEQDTLVPLNDSRRLSLAQFQCLADVPPEAQWFANLGSAQTKRAYQSDLRGFMAFTGIQQPEDTTCSTPHLEYVNEAFGAWPSASSCLLLAACCLIVGTGGGIFWGSGLQPLHAVGSDSSTLAKVRYSP